MSLESKDAQTETTPLEEQEGDGNSRKKRQHHSKSRNGCITCKIRKVKCGEERPICLRCIQSQVKCDGYFIPVTKFRESKPVKLAPKGCRARGIPPPSASVELSHSKGSLSDQRSLDFFIQKTAPLFSSTGDRWFWSKFLLQVSHFEPPVWHAILALSTLHEERLRGLQHQEPRTVRRRYAIQHYNKAIAELTNKLSTKKPSCEVVLVSCVIFISLETVLGNITGAITHLHSGLGIIKSLYSEKSPKSDPQTPRVGMRTIEEEVIPILEILNCNTFMYGVVAPSELWLELLGKPPTEFKSIAEARESVRGILAAGQQLAIKSYSHDPIEDKQSFDAMIYDFQQKLLSRSKGWGDLFARLMARPEMRNLNAKDSREVAYLRLLHSTSLIWSSNALYREETSFDEYVEDFERGIEYGEQTVPAEGEKESSYSYEGENIVPIYFTAVRCRNPTIRWRAVDLLRRIPREGFWDTRMIVKIVEKLIELENEGLEDLRDSTGAIVPNESSRIHQTYVKSELVGDKRKDIATFVRKTASGTWDRNLQMEFFVD